MELGEHCIAMENAVLRGTPRDPLRMGSDVLTGPRAYLTGCTVEDDVFLATGTTVFNGAQIGTRSEVRINGVVHLRTNLPPDTTVPIGWIAVGDPAQLFPPGEHDRLWPAPGHCAEQKATTSNSSPLVSGTPGNRSRPLPAATSIRLSSIPKMTGS